MFSLGLVILEASLSMPIQGVYDRRSNKFDKFALEKYLQRLSQQYGQQSLLTQTLPLMLEIDQQLRPDFVYLSERLPPFKEIDSYFGDSKFMDSRGPTHMSGGPGLNPSRSQSSLQKNQMDPQQRPTGHNHFPSGMNSNPSAESRPNNDLMDELMDRNPYNHRHPAEGLEPGNLSMQTNQYNPNQTAGNDNTSMMNTKIMDNFGQNMMGQQQNQQGLRDRPQEVNHGNNYNSGDRSGQANFGRNNEQDEMYFGQSPIERLHQMQFGKNSSGMPEGGQAQKNFMSENTQKSDWESNQNGQAQTGQATESGQFNSIPRNQSGWPQQTGPQPPPPQKPSSLLTGYQGGMGAQGNVSPRAPLALNSGKTVKDQIMDVLNKNEAQSPPQQGNKDYPRDMPGSFHTVQSFGNNPSPQQNRHDQGFPTSGPWPTQQSGYKNPQGTGFPQNQPGHNSSQNPFQGGPGSPPMQFHSPQTFGSPQMANPTQSQDQNPKQGIAARILQDSSKPPGSPNHPLSGSTSSKGGKPNYNINPAGMSERVGANKFAPLSPHGARVLDQATSAANPFMKGSGASPANPNQGTRYEMERTYY